MQAGADGEHTLIASVHNVRHLVAVLKGLNFSTRAVVSLSNIGLTITTDEARTLLATAYLPGSLFEEYIYSPHHAQPPNSQSSQRDCDEDPSPISFEVQLDSWLACLNIFGTGGGTGSINSLMNSSKKTNKWRGDNDDMGLGTAGTGRNPNVVPLTGDGRATGMRMTYIGPGHPLTMLLAEDASGPKTTCHLTTLEPEPSLELPFDDEDKIVKVIMKSSWLLEALSEVGPSCDKLTIICAPPQEPLATAATAGPYLNSGVAKPTFRIRAVGSFGSTEMDYPNDKDVLEDFECDQLRHFSYRYTNIARATRALQNSLKTSIRIDNSGLLSLQFMMPAKKDRSVEGKTAFIEYRCLALDED